MSRENQARLSVPGTLCRLKHMTVPVQKPAMAPGTYRVMVNSLYSERKLTSSPVPLSPLPRLQTVSRTTQIAFFHFLSTKSDTLPANSHLLPYKRNPIMFMAVMCLTKNTHSSLSGTFGSPHSQALMGAQGHSNLHKPQA